MVTITGCDNYWNTIGDATPSIDINTSDLNDTNPASRTLTAGTTSFPHTFITRNDSGWTISAVHLTTSAKVPGIDAAAFAKVAAGAKANCPVSRVLNAAITRDATLA